MKDADLLGYSTLNKNLLLNVMRSLGWYSITYTPVCDYCWVNRQLFANIQSEFNNEHGSFPVSHVFRIISIK